jgi:N-carbamoylputrescine amidase
MSTVTIGAIQMSCSWNRDQNIAKAESLVRQAATEKNAQIILLQELFETPYFCQKEKPEFFNLATSVEENPAVKHFRTIAQELGVVIPISFFEKAGQVFYNSVAVIDADGAILGVIAKAIFPMGLATKKSTTLLLAIWDQRFGKLGTPPSG